MRIKVKGIDEPRTFDDPIRTELETFLYLSKEELKATASATPLMPVSTSVAPKAMGNPQNVIKLLSEQHVLRNINRLVYTREENERSQAHGLNVSLEAEDNATVAPFYKFASGISFVEFAITHDNEIFFASGAEGAEKQRMPTYGTLLKAVGCMQLDEKVTVEGSDVTSEKLEEIIKYISVYNTSFAVDPDNIAVSLFVLEQLGFDLSASKVIVPNKFAQLIHEINPDCYLNIRGEILKASFYLDEGRFPGAKAIARETSLTILDKITELFYSIDDEILSKRNEKIIKEVELEKSLLKSNIIKLIRRDLFSKEEEATNLDEILIQRQLQVENTTNNQYVAINKIINSLKENQIDLSFLTQEILYLLSFKLQKGGLTDIEKEGLDTWIALNESIPARCYDLESKDSHALIRFYDENPVKTCIALLKDYSKGDGLLGIIMRFLSGAWNRNYIDPVNKVLLMHKNKEFPDNLNIGYIFERLRGSGLVLNLDAPNKSRLKKILLFCANLNGEKESLEQLIDSSLVFFPPYPKPIFSFFRMNRQTSYMMQNRATQVADEAGNASHGEAMVDASTWPTTDGLALDLNMTQETSINATDDESLELNEESVHRQSASPRETFLVGGSDDCRLANEKTTVDDDPENKLFIGQSGSLPHSRASSFTSDSRSRSPSLRFVSALSSHVSCGEQEDNGNELLSHEPFRASF